MFKFKTPSDKTLEVMSEVAKGNTEKDYEKSCISKIKDLTGKEHVRMTSSGNNSIFIALSAVEGDIITQNPINIEQLWFSGGYANMLISYYMKPGSETKHLVNLVYSKDDKGRYVLNLRHNGFGEVLTQENASQMMLGNAYVSFPLSKFITEDNAKLVMTWKWYKSIDYRLDLNTITDYTFEYEWKRSGFEHKF